MRKLPTLHVNYNQMNVNHNLLLVHYNQMSANYKHLDNVVILL